MLFFHHLSAQGLDALWEEPTRLRRMAIDKGMRLLRDDGLRLIRAGVTSVEEVLRVAMR